MGLEFLIFPRLIIKGCCILSNAFSASNEMTFCVVVDYFDGFLYIETSLHPRDEAYLIMVNDHFDVFLDSVCKNLIEYFCINIHRGNWPEVPFLCCVFVWFKYKHNWLHREN